MMPYITILRIIGPYLIAAAIGGAIVGKIQQIRLNHVTAHLQNVKQELSVCQDVNKTNQNSIESLKKEVKAAYAACNSRLQIKDKMLRNIQRIDAIDKQERIENEKKDDPSGTPDNALLDELNRMYPGKQDRQN